MFNRQIIHKREFSIATWCSLPKGKPQKKMIFRCVRVIGYSNPGDRKSPMNELTMVIN
jgi:hypothetical protein